MNFLQKPGSLVFRLFFVLKKEMASGILLKNTEYGFKKIEQGRNRMQSHTEFKGGWAKKKEPADFREP